MGALALAFTLGCDGKGASGTGTKTESKGAAKADGGGADAKAKDKPAPKKKGDAVAERPPPPENLMDPFKLTEEPPEKYKVKFETTKGDFVVEVTTAWSPKGSNRFYNLVKAGYYNDVAFFRAVKGFMVQFGMHGHPAVNRAWKSAKFKDDPVKESNKKGYITFAKCSQPDCRTTQVFINYKNNSNLDKMGFSPFGKVVEGMDIVEGLYTGYGDAPPGGRGPNQGLIAREGNDYLKREFPELDYVKTASIVE